MKTGVRRSVGSRRKLLKRKVKPYQVRQLRELLIEYGLDKGGGEQ